MLFPVLTIIIIFILWMRFKINSSDRSMKDSTKAFWEREAKANSTRKQSLDDIDYITIPLDTLPFQDDASEKIASYQDTIRQLAEKKIANFSGVSNTDLKLTYGAANLDALTEYDLNYTALVRNLYLWGQALYDEGNVRDSKTILEFGVSCKTDISKHYTLLAKIYKSENQLSKISDLITLVEHSDNFRKNSVVHSLNEFLQSEE